MRFVALVAGLTLAITSTGAFAQPAPAAPTSTSTPAPAAASGHYTVAETPLGTLLDDPAAKAVLVKYIPDTVSNPQVDMARGMTLKDMQQYAPTTLTDDTLTKIDADLAMLPSK